MDYNVNKKPFKEKHNSSIGFFGVPVSSWANTPHSPPECQLFQSNLTGRQNMIQINIGAGSDVDWRKQVDGTGYTGCARSPYQTDRGAESTDQTAYSDGEFLSGEIKFDSGRWYSKAGIGYSPRYKEHFIHAHHQTTCVFANVA